MTPPCFLVLERDFINCAIAGIIAVGAAINVVVSEAGDAQELMNDISEIKPDVVVKRGSISVRKRFVVSMKTGFFSFHTCQRIEAPVG
jgi:hypothetical protein